MLSDAYLSVNLDKQVPLRAALVLVLWFKVFQLVLHGLEVLCRILRAVSESENLKHFFTIFCLTPFAILPLCLRAEAVDWRLVVRLAVASVSEWTRLPPHVKKPPHRGGKLDVFWWESLILQYQKRPLFFFFLWHVTCDMWHVTRDTWHVSPVTFHQSPVITRTATATDLPLFNMSSRCTVGWTENTQKPDFFENRKKSSKMQKLKNV